MSSDARSLPADHVVPVVSRTSTNRGPLSNPHRPRGNGRATVLIVIALTAGVAAVWSLVALRQLTSSVARENTDHLDRARKTFDAMRSRTLENLRALSRVMVEDPRLKSTLATEGVDEVTVADILGDLGKLRRTGFLIVLSPEGRVFAQAGADELRGLDLSGSSVVKQAQGTPQAAPDATPKAGPEAAIEAVIGSWVLGGKILDLAIMPVRFGPAPIAYLVVGQAADQHMLNAVAAQTGVSVAIAMGEAVALTAPADDSLKAILTAVIGQIDSAQPRLVELDGETYIAAISDLEESGQARPRLVLVQSLAHASTLFAVLKWMILVPPALVLIAVLFAMIASRRIIVVRQP